MRFAAAIVASPLALALSSCGRHVIPLELPPEPGMKTAIVGLIYQGVLELNAVRVDPFTRKELLPHKNDADGKLALYAVYYAQDLETLELEEGPLTPTMDATRARPLPADPEAIYLAEIGDDSGSWTKQGTLDQELSAFRFRSKEVLCPEYEVHRYPTGSYDFITSAAIVDAGTVLATGSASGQLWRIDKSGISTFPPIHGTRPVSSYRAPDGTIWIGGDTGELWAGTPSEGFVASVTYPLHSSLSWIDGPRGSAGFELFALTNKGGFARFDGSAWETLVEEQLDQAKSFGGVVWLAPGEAIAVPPQPVTLDTIFYHYQNGVAEVRSGASARYGELTSLKWVEDRQRAVTVSKLSKVFEWRGEEFDELAGSPPLAEPSAVASFAPYRRGFIFASQGIVLATFHPLVGYCAKSDVDAPITPRALAPLEGGVVMVGNGEGGEQSEVVVLTEKSP